MKIQILKKIPPPPPDPAVGIGCQAFSDNSNNHGGIICMLKIPQH